ncbi:MAG: CCA tRNA nucleotidyltransferase [Thermoplasmata archaeon]|nr:MAG: CCA tRNA nucleotidyltransferase [Thermoplasmata archaeon]
MNVEEEVLKKIKPSKEEEKEIKKIINELKRKISKEIEKRGVDAKVLLVGSLAKGTYLKNALDIDLFILFPPSVSKEKMKEQSLEIGKEVLPKWKIQYAEHPYVRGEYEGYTVDIVPCYDVQNISKKMSAVDRTPFHTEYIKEHLTQKDEVRLLKQFLKGINCYGAEAKVEGFSGYLAELLILKYGSFRNVLKNASHWKRKTILSLDKEIKSFPENFVFVDPVDPSRNVAAALSPEKLKFFIFAAEEYLKNPRIEFFFPKEIKPLSKEKMKKLVKNFLGVCIPKPDLVDDILYPQIRKAARSIESLLHKNDFHPQEHGYYVNEEILIVLKLRELHLPEKKLHMGPPEEEKEHVKSFILKWKGRKDVSKEPYKKDGRWWVEIKRKYPDAFIFLKENLHAINFGKNLNDLKEKAEVYTDEELRNEKYAKFWAEYFSKEPPWER